MVDKKETEGTILMMPMKTVKFKRTAVTVGLMTLLWLLYTLTIPAPSHAAIFFDSDFELGIGDDWAANGWNDFGQANPGHLEISTDTAFTGTHSVKGTWTDINGSSQQPSIHRGFTPVTRVFVRFAVRASPGFQIGSNGYTKMVRIRGSEGSPTTWLSIYYGNYIIGMEQPFDAGANIINTGVRFSTTSWDQIEFELKLNTPGQANGETRMWVNGVLRIDQRNRQYIGPTPESRGVYGILTPSTLRLSNAQIFVQSGLGNIYYDRFAVGDTRIGPTQSKSTSADSTPPASPQGLQAR